MIRGIKLDAVRSYVSMHDTAKGTPEATVFEIGTLDSRIMGRITDKATTMSINPNQLDDEVETTVNASEVAFETVMYGLRGWKNFVDADGNEIPFKTAKRNHGGQSYTVVHEEVLKQVPRVVITELADQIRRDNELTEDDAKN